jgi:catalase
MANNSHDRRTTGQLVDQKIKRGHGGETHQIAENEVPTLTLQQGVPIADDQNSLRTGPRGSSALEGAHLREKIFHFDHERIPERWVHARGFGAHGFFENYQSQASVTQAGFLSKSGRENSAVRSILHCGPATKDRQTSPETCGASR